MGGDDLRGLVLLGCAPFSGHFQSMIETNPIHARIADLTDRVASLRGYL